MTRRYRYSQWDGSQDVPDLDIDDVFDELSDSLLYHGDVASALRELMAKGMRRPDGSGFSGLNELMERLRRKREEMLSKYGMDATYEKLRDELEAVVDEEAKELDRLGKDGLKDTSMKQLELSALPDELPGRLRSLREYEFESSEARDRFEQLLDDLRKQMMESTFSQMKQALGDQSPEDMERLRQMMSDLNDMMEMKKEGLDTTEAFATFKEKYGDMLPEVDSLEELLSVMEEQAQAMASFLNSLDPDARAELMDLMTGMLEDLDLAWQMDRFSQNLTSLGGQLGGGRYGFRGDTPAGMGEVGEMFSTLGQIDSLEGALKGMGNPGALPDVDLEAVEAQLGKDARDSLERLAEMAKRLEEEGLIDRNDGYLKIAPKGLRKIAGNALDEVFSQIDSAMVGQHRSVRTGGGTDLEYQTRPYEFGDRFNLSIRETLRNAMMRQGGGVPIKVIPEDFEVETNEALLACSTVVALDLSLSMPLRDNFLPAKKVAMALQALISSRFPRDYLGIVGFSEVARELKAVDVPHASWDYVYGTNMEHALMLARKMLSTKRGYKQIIMVTDGEPTARIVSEPNMAVEVEFSYPPSAATIRATLAEVMRVTKADITLNTFVLDATEPLRHFMDQVVAINRGRAFYVDPAHLGDYVLVDFLNSRRTHLGG